MNDWSHSVREDETGRFFMVRYTSGAITFKAEDGRGIPDHIQVALEQVAARNMAKQE